MNRSPRSSRFGNRVKVLRAVAEHLNREIHLRPMLESALDLILRLLDLRAGWIFLLDDEGRFTQWRRFDGTVIWVRESARVVRDAAGRPAYYEGSAEDITARKRVEADLQYLASHDPLTGAFNRHRFQEELHRLIAQARRTRSKRRPAVHRPG